MTWLLTGGAGYIGAHVLRALRGSGRDVVVVDDLSTGHAAVVPDDVPLVRADVRDREALVRVMTEHSVTGVVHLAAKKAVGESVAEPLRYYRENVDGALALAEAMVGADVTRIVYSSSAAVYGDVAVDLVTEDVPTRPVSPYGETKLVGEWIFRDAAVAHGFAVTALRYFNVAGAASDELADTAAANLIPMVLRAHARGERPQIFGADYPTPDGTCIRDYIHVADLADAHVAAAATLDAGEPGFAAYNIGRGTGSSVREVVASVAAAIGVDLDAEVVGRRPGDPAVLVASARRATDGLGWTATRDLDAMTTSAWSAFRARQTR
ncbi:MAG TPA: UDP-glucose 4-epimerase GalE [Candidatus Angelobacter sp.]|nr:UDP-glucose 4-epimerase GalE [Candidatus Angelobacter sp.]